MSSAEERAKSIYVFANEKGGMAGIDKEAINRIILATSGESAYTRRQLKQDAKVEGRIKALCRTRAELDRASVNALRRRVDERVAELEHTRRLDRACAVIDFDMFYAAVEIRDRPELASKPVAVGGIGMISTANYVARRWGVRSAMPGFVGQELCRRGPEFGMPAAELVFVRPDFGKYTAVAAVARAIFREYDAQMRSYSLDEAYLDLTRYVARRERLGSHALARDDVIADGAGGERGGEGEGEGDGESGGEPADAACIARRFALAESVVQEIRARVCDATGGLTVSAGLAPNFLLAKVCADQRKPNGQYGCQPSREEILNFLSPLPVRKIGGIGRVQEKVLGGALGVRTCGELRQAAVDIAAVFSPVSADFLLRASLGWADGRDDAPAEAATAARGVPAQKGMSVERTFRATADAAALGSTLRWLTTKLADDLAACSGTDGVGARARTVTIKLKTDEFDVHTRDSTGEPARTADELYARAGALLERELERARAEARPLRLRLMGVRATKLERADADADGRCAHDDRQLSIAHFLRRDTGDTADAEGMAEEEDGEDGGAEDERRSARAGSPARDGPSARRTADASLPSTPTRAAKYVRLAEAEVDPAVLAELPDVVAAEVRAELRAAGAAGKQPVRKHACAAEQRARSAQPARRESGGIHRFFAASSQPASPAHVNLAMSPTAEVRGGRRHDDGDGHVDSVDLASLVGMGFAEADAVRALLDAAGDLPRAVEQLLTDATARSPTGYTSARRQYDSSSDGQPRPRPGRGPPGAPPLPGLAV